MRTDNKKNNFWIILLMAVLTVCLSGRGYCRPQESEGYAMMIQCSPVDGGTISPGVGIHRFGLNEVVTLTATPKPGYQFVFWLGDVLDETSEQTTTVANSPKIIIAVFERTEYASLAELNLVSAGFGGGGGAVGGTGDSGSPSPTGSSTPPQEFPDRPPFDYPSQFPVPGDEPGDIPVPESGGFPVPEDNPVPEPATMLLFGMGAVSIAVSRRKVRNQPMNTLEG